MKTLARSALAAALALAAAPALAQTYSQTIFFGDSLTDAGAFRPGLIQVGGPTAALVGRFTTNPGLVWSEYLANYYGTGATPSNQGGTNYAVGGARGGVNGTSPFGPIPSVSAQVSGYLAANGGRADPNALYTVWSGANDIFAVAAGAPAQTTIATAVGAHVTAVASLRSAGARYILVPTVPDTGLTPSARAQGPAAQAALTRLAVTYNSSLFAGLSGAGLRVIPLNTFSLFQEVVANPGAYGFANITGTACQPQITANSLTCTPNTLVSPGAADSYLFADGVHPTSRAHQLLSEFAVSVLEAPRQVAVLPYSAKVVGRSRADRVSEHADLAADAEGEGMRWWVDARGDSLRYDTGIGFDGVAPGLTGGVDWTRGGMVYGVFGGIGRSYVDFGERRGDFEQLDGTLGGFFAWRGESVWVNAQASYTWLRYDVDREIWLGPSKRSHGGSPDGRNLTVGVNAGFEFGDEGFRHGPVVGVLAQRIEVDGFAESDPALSTSLAYPDQEYDSLIGRVGWRARLTGGGHLQPYAQLTYEREFEDEQDEAFARVQSLPATGEYAVPGLRFDDSYGMLLLGARTQAFGLDANVGVSATVGHEGGNDATVFATVGARF